MEQLDLFAGIGGFSLAGHVIGWTTKGLVEKDKRRQADLRSNFPGVPIFGDIKAFDGKKFIDEHGPIDIISGGFPCQPFSTAGKRLGASDDRFLWPEMLRVIKEVQPLGSVVKMLLESPAWESQYVTLKWSAEKLAAYRKKTIMRQYLHSKKECSSTQSVKTLKTRVTRSNRLLFRLRVSGPRTSETAFGLLPIISSSGGGRKVNQETHQWTGKYWKTKEGRKVQSDVRHIIQNMGLLPTWRSSGAGTQLTEARQKDTFPNLETVLSRVLLSTPTKSMATINDMVQAMYHSSKRPKYEASNLGLLGTPTSRDWKDRSPLSTGPVNGKLPLQISKLVPTPLASDGKKGEGSNWTHNKLRQMYRRQWGIHWHEVATRFCRVDDGIPAWLDSSPTSRLEGLGNAVVWQIPLEIFISIDTVNKSLKSEIDQL